MNASPPWGCRSSVAVEEARNTIGSRVPCPRHIGWMRPAWERVPRRCLSCVASCPGKSVRIAGGLGFYGDSWRPIKASIERGNVQYVASDHLAELTLAILQKDRQRDPNLGYTRDLVPMLAELLPIAIPRGIKFVLNAGGLNPMAAREVLLGALKKCGLKLKVGVVLGDSVQARLDELQAAGVSLAHMDTGEDFTTVRDRLVFASAYLGARPLVEALDAGADIVLTG